MNKCVIKIISGDMKKKHIEFLFDSCVKPTKSNVRENFFSWVAFYFDRLYVLDLFSGSGVFCFEFLSRGVKKVIMLEKDIHAYTFISKNGKVFSAYRKKINLYLCDSVDWISMYNFLNVSLIILDPPYGFSYFKTYFLLLDKIIFLKKCLLVFVETNNSCVLFDIPYDWFLLKKGCLGKTYFYFLKKI